jgi:hypothetical protein
MPSGALITLDGEHRWHGTTPWTLQRDLNGSYRVEAELSGYESWVRTLSVSPGDVRDLEIRLDRKTAAKAAVRSLLVPGWGQRYGERPGKAALLFGAAVVAGGGALWAHLDYRDEVRTFERARDAYLDEQSVETIPDRRRQMEEASRDAGDVYDLRQGFLLALGGIYAVSLIDALFLSPGPSEGAFSMGPANGKPVSLALFGTPDGVSLGLKYSRNLGGAR